MVAWQTPHQPRRCCSGVLRVPPRQPGMWGRTDVGAFLGVYSKRPRLGTRNGAAFQVLFDPPRHQVPESRLLAGAGRSRAPEGWKRCHAQNHNDYAGINACPDDRCQRRSLSVPATGGGGESGANECSRNGFLQRLSKTKKSE